MHSGGIKKSSQRRAAIESALRTVAFEQAGMAALAEALSGGLAEPFVRAVEILSTLQGRVIVTGVGKSGHIGSKIAATLASTGTPAYVVHPAEANHGDLGMITVDDAIIAMSWSGESVELKVILSYAKRFAIPLIAITAGENSTLAREADVVICLPQATEACPHKLAPTTSTLLQLAIGDALAVALMEVRGFTADQFRTFHPGGKLGANLTHVGEIMHTGDEMPVVALGTKMPEAVAMLARKRFGCVCVTDHDGKLAGIFTDGDLARNLGRKKLSELAVEEIMTRRPKTVKPETLAGAAMGLLNEHHISALIVVEDGKPIGVVHFHDLLRIGAA
jgi:arabinose-5-phosphate isomerase